MSIKRLTLTASAIAISLVFASNTISYAEDTVTEIIKKHSKSAFSNSEKEIISKYFSDKKEKNQKSKKSESDDDYGKGHLKKAHKNKGKGKDKSKGKSKSMPHGLAKRDNLPPGLAKHVEKHGKLPSGLAKRDLPNDLNSLLPPVAKGLERIIAGDDLVLMEKGTQLVLDVIKGAAAQ